MLRREAPRKNPASDNNRSAIKEFTRVFSYGGTGNLLVWTMLEAQQRFATSNA
jgi:hypothetical protein